MRKLLMNSVIAVIALFAFGCTQTIELPAPTQQETSETRAPADFYVGYLSQTQVTIASGTSTSFANIPYSGGSYPGATFLWEQSTNGTSWTIAPGTNNLFWYQTPSLYATTYYRQKVTYNGQWGYTEVATVNVVAGLVAGSIGSSQVVYIGYKPAALTTTTPPSGGLPPYSLQWQSSDDGASWTTISGANTSSYQPPQYYGPPTYKYYRLRVSAGSQTAYTNTVSTQFIAPYSPGTIGHNQTINWGTSPAKLVGLTGPSGGYNGPPTFNYGWYRSHDGVNWINIAGAYGQDYQPPQLSSTMYFRRYAGNTVNTGYSNVVTITVRAR